MSTSSDPATEPEQAYVERQSTEWSDAEEPNTVPSGDTLEADRRDAAAAHDPDRPPTPEEEAAAPSEADPGVSRAYEEANQRGANVKGEGQIS
jgi:hypothetical protein